MTIVDDIAKLFAERGSGAYFGEEVTETEHALQCADLAVRCGASDASIVAALLHDVGHLLHDLGEDIADRGHDAVHEEAGARWLRGHFGPAIVDPVRLHVAAKRYLCAVEPGYHADLSAASRRSLELQGGPMSTDERGAFEAEPYFREAVALRRWDDAAKVRGLIVPEVDAYRQRLEELRIHSKGTV
jgi:[1-hydroxy-2-(trimethylamino)ethyl]phosphonate dioxygenase